MLIQVFRNSFEQGILKNEYDGSSILAPFIGGANVAFRKEAIIQAGMYDPRCLTMEDADICIRISKLNWEIYRQPSAKVRHKNPTNLRSLIKQWKGYMTHMPYLYQKHNLKAIEIFAFDKNIGKIHCIFYHPFHIPILIVLNKTLKFYVLFIFFIIFSLMELPLPAYLTLGLGLFYFFNNIWNLSLHFYINMKRLGYFKKTLQTFIILLQFVIINLIENLTIIIFSFLGGLRYKMLFIYGDPSH